MAKSRRFDREYGKEIQTEEGSFDLPSRNIPIIIDMKRCFDEQGFDTTSFVSKEIPIVLFAYYNNELYGVCPSAKQIIKKSCCL